MRAVVPAVPGETWLVTVGLGGSGVPGNPGQAGQASFVNSPAGFVASAFGGLGGSSTTPGLGGFCDIAGLAMALCRRGGNGSQGAAGLGGSGGRAVFGSIEPIGSVGGRGADASVTPTPGAPGTDGYVLISW